VKQLGRRAATGPQVTVVGDTFLDQDWIGSVDRVAPDAPVPVLQAAGEICRPGGAGLAATHAAEAGADVTLVTALGDDDEGERVRAELDAARVTVVDLGLAGRTPVKLRLRSSGQSLVRVDRHCSTVASIGGWLDAATDATRAADAVLVSDYGRGMAGQPALGVLVHRARGCTPVVWDPHPRGVRPPRGELDLLTPNLAEAGHLTGRAGGAVTRARGPVGPGTATTPSQPIIDALELAEQAGALYDCAVAVTAGDRGAVLAEPGQQPVLMPVEATAGDVCGAGDRFAATVAVERAGGAQRQQAVERAVDRARRHVAGDPGGEGSLRWLPGISRDPVAFAARARADGRVVVAAGGCFDVLHAGHVHLLEGARRLGDCLIVCMNSDDSVRRRKGPPRPIHPLADRIRVVQGLGCVDAVLPFDEETPDAALRELRPHLFVKGADYADQALPEREVLAGWDGRVVLLPLLRGRSTTHILDAAAG